MEAHRGSLEEVGGVAPLQAGSHSRFFDLMTGVVTYLMLTGILALVSLLVAPHLGLACWPFLWCETLLCPLSILWVLAKSLKSRPIETLTKGIFAAYVLFVLVGGAIYFMRA